jgi:hypothetical protein
LRGWTNITGSTWRVQSNLISRKKEYLFKIKRMFIARYQLSALCFFIIFVCEVHAILIDTLYFTEPSFMMFSQIAIAPTVILMLYSLIVAQVEYWRSFHSLIGPLLIITFTVVTILQLSVTMEKVRAFKCTNYFALSKEIAETARRQGSPLRDADWLYEGPLCQVYPLWNVSAIVVIAIYCIIAWCLYEDDRRQLQMLRTRSRHGTAVLTL